VSVDEGVVRVRVGDEETSVAAGETWPAAAAAATDPDPDPAPAPVPAPAPARKKKPAKPAPPAPPPPPKGPTPAEEYARAARLEASDLAAARAIYQELATRDDGWGATALYALAVLEDGRGQRAAAARHLRAYLRRFPQGANAADARSLLERIE
jgi:hypothetical protein